MVLNFLNLVQKGYWKSMENDIKNVWEPWTPGCGSSKNKRQQREKLKRVFWNECVTEIPRPGRANDINSNKVVAAIRSANAPKLLWKTWR